MQGMRTVIATNATQEQIDAEAADAWAHNEVWVRHPEPERHWHLRAGLIPLDAIQLLGTSYKWLLVGDDDTVFFLSGVRKVVDALDPKQTWFISGTAV